MPKSILFCPILVLFLGLSLSPVQAQQEKSTPQNSTRKIRVVPSRIAARIGSGVKWQSNVDEAMKLSQKTGKPLFWYVPTLAGSFMDRKTEIDRYMMAGPFSWQTTRMLLNDHFIPVRALPTKEQQQQHDLKPFEFVEPGFLIIDAAGTVKTKVDKITTLHHDWFVAMLSAQVDGEIQWGDWSPGFLEQYTKFANGDWASYEAPADLKQHENVHFMILEAMRTFRRGDHQAAKKIWATVAEQYPDHPGGWKAAAESEGFGPFTRGFEIHRKVPEAALAAGTDSEGSSAPPKTYSESELWERGVDFLLGMQRRDGGWVDCDYDFGGTDSLPNVHVAVTSLAAMSLLEARSRLPKKQQQIDSAIDRAVNYVTNEQNLTLYDKDELFWAYAYRLRLLSKLVSSTESLRDKFNFAGEALQNIQGKGGNWYHEYRNPFVTASALCALHEAKQAGFETDDSKIKQGLDALSRDRYKNGAYPYASRRSPGRQIAGNEKSIAASAGRMPLCEMALTYWNASDQKNLESAVRKSLEYHKHLDSALKYDDHTSNMAYGGFFFWYDMRSRSEAISQIKNMELRQTFASQHRELILALPEIDGCFVDSHELGRCYGTAMALLSLSQLAE